MASEDLKMCRCCGKMIVFLQSPKGGRVPCNSFSVKVVPEKGGKLYYLGEGRTIWGRKVEAGTSGAVTAWESHYGTCPNPDGKTRKRVKKTPAQIAKAREDAEQQRQRVEAALLASREKEWAAAGYG